MGLLIKEALQFRLDLSQVKISTRMTPTAEALHELERRVNFFSRIALVYIRLLVYLVLRHVVSLHCATKMTNQGAAF